MWRPAVTALLAMPWLFGCLHRRPPSPASLVAAPHYVVGGAYQAGGHWYYPAEDDSLDASGIATVQEAGTGLTADGEIRDAGALTASMQTIQLPVVVQVTNLENGRQVLVRVNDRGPASPGRIIAVSPRAALLLAMPASGAARVRVRLEQAMSRQLADALGGGKLRIATSPAASVTEEALPPPGGGAAGPARVLGGAPADMPVQAVPERLPERIGMTYANPGQLMVRAGTFGRAHYANAVAARLSGLGADVVRSRDGRQTIYAVQAGPFATIPMADAALAEALRAGVIDAHITVE